MRFHPLGEEGGKGLIANMPHKLTPQTKLLSRRHTSQKVTYSSRQMRLRQMLNGVEMLSNQKWSVSYLTDSPTAAASDHAP